METESNTIIRGLFKRWQIEPPAEQADALARQLHLPLLVGQLLARRGYDDPETAQKFIRPSLADMHDPKLLAGCEKAATRIVEAIRNDEKIVIYGDYDVDGVTASSILFHMLKACDQNANIIRYIPHRIDEGYGVHAQAIEKFAADEVKLIITVDCGITAIEPAKTAKKLNIDFIITDHHEQSEEGLPDAFALVHPSVICQATNEMYPFDGLCGAGVAYKLAWQIARAWCGNDDKLPNALKDVLMETMPLAALGTIADIVPLVDENRVIVAHGLGRVKHTANIGLNALIDASNLREEKIDCFHVGFVLGPRLNAAGRMGHAKKALWLLTDAPENKATQIATFLHTENEKRKITEREIVNQAIEMVQDAGHDQDDVRAIVLAHEDWHPGVVGIVCSRLVERFGRPTILLNITDGIASGSARSISGFNLHEALNASSEHLTQFGGHAMAAGMKLPSENINAFRDAFVHYANDHLKVEDLTPLIKIDAEARLLDLDFAMLEHLQRLAPFGQGNPQPLFLVKGATVDQPAKTMGATAKHLQMFIRQDETVRRCVGWNLGHLATQLPGGTQLDLVCKASINEFRGKTYIDLNINDIKFV